MIEEKVRIKCTKCTLVFRERATRVRDGLQVNCMHCNRLITFDINSEDRNIRRALSSARVVRAEIEAHREAQRQAANLAQATPAPVMDRSQY